MKSRKKAKTQRSGATGKEGMDPQPLPAGSPAGNGPTEKHRILLIEDEIAAAEWYEVMLSAPDRQIDLAHSGVMARELLLNNTYAIIFVDLHLPDTSGLDLIREIRKRGISATVFALTGDATLEAVIKALDYGADDYLLKPPLRSRLEELVVRTLTEGGYAGEGNKSRLGIIEREDAGTSANPAEGTAARIRPTLTPPEITPGYAEGRHPGELLAAIRQLDADDPDQRLETAILINTELHKIRLAGMDLRHVVLALLFAVERDDDFFVREYICQSLRTIYLDKHLDVPKNTNRLTHGNIAHAGQGGSLQSSDDKIKQDRSALLDALLATVPEDAPYKEQAGQLEGLKVAANKQIDDRLSKLLRDEMERRGRDAKSYATKLNLVRWFNAELLRFNLAIYSPKLGGHATLSADEAGRGGEGRFKLKVKGSPERKEEMPSTLNTQSMSELLENIELTEAPQRREAFRELVKEARQQSPTHHR